MGAPEPLGARNGCSSTPRSRRGARNDCSSPPQSRRWLEMAIRSRWSASPNLRYIANVRLPTDWKCSVWTFIFPSFFTHHLVERTLQKCTCLKMLTRGSTRPCLHHFVQKRKTDHARTTHPYKKQFDPSKKHLLRQLSAEIKQNPCTN